MLSRDVLKDRTVLVVDDDPDLVEAVCMKLESEQIYNVISLCPLC